MAHRSAGAVCAAASISGSDSAPPSLWQQGPAVKATLERRKNGASSSGYKRRGTCRIRHQVETIEENETSSEIFFSTLT